MDLLLRALVVPSLWRPERAVLPRVALQQQPVVPSRSRWAPVAQVERPLVAQLAAISLSREVLVALADQRPATVASVALFLSLPEPAVQRRQEPTRVLVAG